MIVNRADDFLCELRRGAFPAEGPVCAKAVLMVEPADFSVSTESATDNHYMNLTDATDAQRALGQARGLAELIAKQGIEVVCFPGDPDTPDAIFPNNVFATTNDRFIIGHMLHPGRQKEADRQDIHAYFQSRAYAKIDLRERDCIAELTGVLIIDTARRIGFCGMSGRVDQAGLEAMHDAFGLRMVFSFALQPGEYHTNVIMMVLASRACVMYPGAFIDPAVPMAIAEAFPGRTLLLNEAEKNAFAGNCIALTEQDLFMSQTGLGALRPSSLEALNAWGFVIHSTKLDEIEKAGGSLRCMLAEIF
jgi:hypothetical protein